MLKGGSGGGGESGDSDFSTAEVTVVTAEGAVNVPIKRTSPFDGSEYSQAVFMNEAITYTVILYKGKLLAALEEPESYYIEKVSGDVEIIDVEGLTGVGAVITGDCSINIKNRLG